MCKNFEICNPLTTHGIAIISLYMAQLQRVNNNQSNHSNDSFWFINVQIFLCKVQKDKVPKIHMETAMLYELHLCNFMSSFMITDFHCIYIQLCDLFMLAKWLFNFLKLCNPHSLCYLALFTHPFLYKTHEFCQSFWK